MGNETTNDRRWPRAPRLGTVLGAAALFFALQGNAFALPGTSTVDSGDITNGQVKAVDIHAGAVGADQLRATWIQGLGVVVTAGTSNTVTATCPAGYQAVGTGFNWDVSVAGLHTTSVEISATNAVTVTGFNDTVGNRTLSARAYCIKG
jgi:hypothetical protein